MVTLKEYHAFHYEDLISYELAPEQARYTRQPWQWFDCHTLMTEPGMRAISILYRDRAVGFFILDRGYDKFNYTDNSQAILLRSFSINPRYQGKGIASQAMKKSVIEPIIYNISPKYNEIVLAVNPYNLSAYHLYKKCGFQSAGRVIIKRGQTNTVLFRTIGSPPVK